VETWPPAGISPKYFTEDLLAEACDIELLPHRKKNSRRTVPAYVEYIQQSYCKKISGGIQSVGAPYPRFNSRSYSTWVRIEGLPVRACL
jgi:hypothetical protein